MYYYKVMKRYKKTGLSGPVDIPVGTRLACADKGIILYSKKPLCMEDSTDSYTYLAYDEDHKAEKRWLLIRSILKKTSVLNKDEHNRLMIIYYLNTIPFYSKYKNEQSTETKWIWNLNFYKAPINVLSNIFEKINFI